MMNEKTKITTLKMRQEPKGKKIKVSRILIHALLLLLVFINIFPLYWMLTFSLKNNDEIQGYGYYGKSYWDEVEESIEKGTGNRIEVAWKWIDRAIIGSAESAVSADPLDPNIKTQPFRKTLINRILDEKWETLKSSIYAIDGFYDEDKTDEDWNRIKDEAAEIINSIIKEGISEHAATAEKEGPMGGANATEEEKQIAALGNFDYTFAFSRKKWPEFKTGVETIVELQEPDPVAVWAKIRQMTETNAAEAVQKDKKLDDETRAERLPKVQEALDLQWENIKASILAIDTISNPIKTEADWNDNNGGIRVKIESIVAETVKKELQPKTTKDETEETADITDETETAEVEETEAVTADENAAETEAKGEAETVPEIDFAFAYTDEDWNEIRTLLTPKDPWAKVKDTLVDVLGDDAKKLNDKPRILVPPNRIGLPKSWAWENYPGALKTGNIVRNFVNSLVVSASTIIITILAAFMATYAMTRLVWKGRKTMNKFFMLGLTIPIHAAIVPVYIILSKIHWLDTYQALIIPYSAFSLAMAILISVGFMGDIPYDLDEAAFLDGCGIWGIFFRVILPLMMPAVATVGIYTFLQCWNELLFATIFVSKGAYKTLPVGMQEFVGQYTTDWGRIGAGLSIATIPTLIVYIALSKRIQAGFIAGAVKG